MTVYKAKKAAGKIGLYALVLIVVLPILFPLYFVFISSLKNMSQVYIMPPQLFGFTPIWIITNTFLKRSIMILT